jgi:eukaryotic-like serine/threonine-protein kinase
VGTNELNPRILILESDRNTCAELRTYVVKGWRGASVQTIAASLDSVIGDHKRLKDFDVILVGCNFSQDGTANNPTLRAVRALAADPNSPPVILLTESGSEYTAVQAVKSGAADYLPKTLMSREQVLTSVQKALIARRSTQGDGEVTGVLRLFGYDIRRCLANHENVSVHVAFSAEQGKEVVIKVLHRGKGSLSRDVTFERFIDEFKMLHDIHDAAVPDIYDFRVTDRYTYIAMEYFADGHLGKRLAEPVSVDEALSITLEIAHSLAIIHAAGIVHRDLKPGNIMLRTDGSAALIDFGISQAKRDEEEAPGPDQDAGISGTPYYMSPEQARGEPTDERTDLYSLGVILYQMLTGQRPYVGDDTAKILDQHKDAPVPALPPELVQYQGLVDRLLAKNVEQRLANARELGELVDEVRAATAEEPDFPLPSASSA